jgi:hypothetical protein
MNDKPPDGLDESGQELWQAAQGAIRSNPCASLGLMALGLLEQLRLEAAVNQLAAEVAGRDATILMACHRLGGLVEGQPPTPLNFLQRIDELVQIEAEVARKRGR